MEPPKTESIDPLGNSPQDYYQGREELSLRYYGCEFRKLTKTKKAKVTRWVRQRQKKQLKLQEKYAMPLRETLIDYHERNCHEDETTTIRRIDLRRAFDKLKEKYGETVCEAAVGFPEYHTKEEAAMLLGMRKEKASRLVDEANAEAVSLLLDYYPILPAKLQRKYREQYQERVAS